MEIRHKIKRMFHMWGSCFTGERESISRTSFHIRKFELPINLTKRLLGHKSGNINGDTEFMRGLRWEIEIY